MASVKNTGFKFLPGDVIERGQPFLYCISARVSEYYCSTCFMNRDDVLVDGNRIRQLKSCGHCGQFKYCGRKCQVDDWKKFHKHECKIYASHADKLQHHGLRVALRLAIIHENRPEDLTRKFKLMNGSERSFADLESHETEVLSDEKRYGSYFKTLDALNSLGLRFNPGKLFMSIARLNVNSFGILDISFKNLGTGLYIETSIFDHSCEPNAAYIFNGSEMRVRAIKPIHFNEPVYINYTDCKQSRSARQALLLDNYYFTCECTRCTREGREGEDTSILREIASINSQYADIVSRAPRHTSEVIVNKCFRLLMEKVCLYQKIFGQFHPAITFELLKCSKLSTDSICVDNPEEFSSFLGKLVAAFLVTHGEDHYLWDCFKDLLPSATDDAPRMAADEGSGQREVRMGTLNYFRTLMDQD